MTDPDPVYVAIYHKGYVFRSGPMTEEQADRLPAQAMMRLVMERMADVEEPS